MTEEQVTKAILSWLISLGWNIICYDFPQSGTGVYLHPNGSKEKNKESINPDIVAVKDNICLFFENKSYFYFPDFEKINMLRTTDKYSNDINALLKEYHINCIKYGIGYPRNVHKDEMMEIYEMVDFIVGVKEDNTIEILYDNLPDFKF